MDLHSKNEPKLGPTRSIARSNVHPISSESLTWWPFMSKSYDKQIIAFLASASASASPQRFRRRSLHSRGG